LVSPKRHFEARLIARDTSMTTRSTRRVGPLAVVCAWLAFACLADASAAGAAPAAASVAASAGAPASAPAGPAATQYAVKPGQSLADIAIAATQSHDRNIVARASKAIFDANPSAFMRGDPSLLKLGAVLNVPPLDATGAVVKAEAAPAVAAASTPNAASAASGTAAPAGAASAKASGVQATKPASSPAGAAPQGPASGAASAPGAAPAVATPAAPTAATRPQPSAPVGASGEHAWTGAIEPAPAPASEATPAGASGAEASTAVAASGAASASAVAGEAASSGTAATGVSGAASASAPNRGAPASAVAASAAAASHPKVSSLQQLLTLKNRVLMELQRHGFGAPSSARSGAAGNAPVGASGFTAAPPASGVVATAPGPSRQAAAANQRFVGIGNYGFNVARSDVPAIAAVIAAVCAALLVLLIALGVSRRKRRAPRPIAGAAAGSAAAIERDELNPPAAPPAAAANDPIEAEFLAILARNPSSKRALMGLVAHYAERKNVRGFDEIAQRIYRLSSGRGPNWVHVAALGRQLDPDNPLFALEAGATNEDVLSEPSETDLLTDSTADVLAPAVPPTEPAQPPVEHPRAAPAIPVLTDVAPPEAPITDVPSAGETLPEAEAAHHAAPGEAAAVPEVPSDQSGSTPAPEPDAAPEPWGEATLPPEAVAALGGLDLGLPPRIEGGAERSPTGIGEPEREHDAAHELGHDADEAPIARAEAHTESPLAAEPSERAEGEPTPARGEPPARPAVSGLGAAPVGPLKLSFNLDLPGDETGDHEASAAGAPLPQFTPEQLAKIARNKLDLASEYIALGDLGGARTLIHEVIESNDAATRDEAHALLATLAPLS
jgi:pilus assembly protein FimV